MLVGSQTRRSLPVLPLRDCVLFPNCATSLFVGRESSLRALDAAMRHDKQIVAVRQRAADQDQLRDGDLYETGTIATIATMMRLDDGSTRIGLDGGARVRVGVLSHVQGYIEAEIEPLSEGNFDEGESEMTSRAASLAALEAERRDRRPVTVSIPPSSFIIPDDVIEAG